MSNRTGLLFIPAEIERVRPPFYILHTEKLKNGTSYRKEPLALPALRKSFPKLPDALLNQWSALCEKKLLDWKTDLMQSLLQVGNDSNRKERLQKEFQAYIHKQLVALKPLFSAFPFYHQVASPRDPARLLTCHCSFSTYSPGLRFQVVESAPGMLAIESELELNGSFYPLTQFNRNGFLLEQRNEYFLLRQTDRQVLDWLDTLDWKSVSANPAAFAEQVIGRLEAHHPVERNGLLETEAVEAKPIGSVVLSELSGQFLMLTPQFDYDGWTVDGAWQPEERRQQNGLSFSIKRNRESEEAIVAQISSLHEKFPSQSNGYFYLSFSEAQKKHWFLKSFRALLDMEIEVRGMDMLKHFRYCPDKPVTELELLKEENGQLEFKCCVSFGKEIITLAELQKQLRAGQQAIPLKDNSIALLEDEWLKQYGMLFKHAVVIKDRLRIPRSLAMALNLGDGLVTSAETPEEQQWKQKWKRWQTAAETVYPLPASVSATLRPYQQKGYEWMCLLRDAGMGMFLADDMGLGKTLQTICFLSSLIEDFPHGQVLIICPASLIYNWQHEFEKFAASVSTCVQHGAGRAKRLPTADEVRVIITSYGTLRSDASLFLDRQFVAAVLDESHTIKNPTAQITRLVQELNAGHRLVLSGTPVMNNTFDLFSQLQFSVPGLLGGQAFFKREYADPIDRYGDQERATALQKLTAPFILRRTKEQVATDLPPKTEILHWCEMEDAQRNVYEEYREQVKGEIISMMKSQGLQTSKLQVLQGMMKLRQICNSPELLKDAETICTDSAKTTELLREIENNAGKHKILVFSQFTSMLALLEKEFSKRKINYYLLTGQTPPKERDRLVQSFNSENSEAQVFLISLKAGNAGLNLTAADYVFLFDPWWNSAVEQQAIDRTHRIGQTKNVFAYKLVCKNSIEERIVQLQQRKKELAGSLVVEEEGFVKALTEEDVEFLIS